MICPECGYNDSKVIDSRPAESKIRRRRECLECSNRFTTYEIIEDIPVMVIKKDGTIEPFDSQKLTDKLLRATIKRPVKLKTIENLVDSMLVHFKNNLQREVTSDKIGEFVLRRLGVDGHALLPRTKSGPARLPAPATRMNGAPGGRVRRVSVYLRGCRCGGLGSDEDGDEAFAVFGEGVQQVSVRVEVAHGNEMRMNGEVREAVALGEEGAVRGRER